MADIGPGRPPKLKKQKRGDALPTINLRSKRLKACPECGEKLQRAIKAIQRHFVRKHKKVISEGEAFRISTTVGSKRLLYAEGLRTNYREVQGGLPSLGKRK